MFVCLLQKGDVYRRVLGCFWEFAESSFCARVCYHGAPDALRVPEARGEQRQNESKVEKRVKKRVKKSVAQLGEVRRVMPEQRARRGLSSPLLLPDQCQTLHVGRGGQKNGRARGRERQRMADRFPG
ncbi:unnamed protein product [Pleuronectes platessa]|uniref:Uncharacterized protein n=1 Tax=Pleuronectes platessa TaxID=8262 RepID=A0A9N7VSN1_PLEPL|nr:unnamed protein product [Pleuronectes platessa]